MKEVAHDCAIPQAEPHVCMLLTALHVLMPQDFTLRKAETACLSIDLAGGYSTTTRLLTEDA